MAVDNGRAPSNGVSIKGVVGIAFGILTIAAGVAAGVGTYSGWQGAREAMIPEIARFDAKVEEAENRFAEMVASARQEAGQRRDEIRREAMEQRREVEDRLMAEITELHKILDVKADEDHVPRVYDEISRVRDRLERMEALVYGRSGGAR